MFKVIETWCNLNDIATDSLAAFINLLKREGALVLILSYS